MLFNSLLVLCDDTTGATSDLLCSAVARSVSGLPYGGGGALGIVIVSRQRTSRDGEATLKFNCGQDDLIKRLVDRCNTLSTQYLHSIYTLSTHTDMTSWGT